MSRAQEGDTDEAHKRKQRRSQSGHHTDCAGAVIE